MAENLPRRFLLRRYLLFFAAVLINGYGIALITRAALGTSSITSLFYVLSMFTPLTLGQWTIAGNLSFMLLEALLLTRAEIREDLRAYLLQIPITLCFGITIDASMDSLSWFAPAGYLGHMAGLLAGCFILALGIALEVKASVALVAGEYMVHTIARRLRSDFGYTKLAFDCTLLASACVTSLCVFGGIRGVREGTLISALIVGPIVHFLYPKLLWLNKYLEE